MFPATATIKDLEQQHPEYRALRETWATISDLRDGASAMLDKAALYLPKRPGEDPELYNLRLQKFSYTPLMSNAIREFTAKLAGSPVNVSGANDPFWDAFRDHMDGQSADEPEILNRIFSCLLYYGRVYVGMDRPKTDLVPRSRQEDLMLPSPYLLLYEPLAVTNWGQGWYLTRQTVTTSEPLKEPRRDILWTYWTSEGCFRYQCPEGKLGNPKYRVPQLDPVLFQGTRMFSLVLPTEMWVGNSVYRKQLQHCWIESSWTDAGAIAGLVQRVFTPSPPKPLDDPRMVFEDPIDHRSLGQDNHHVLIGSGFSFSESTGVAIANLTSQLETIERQIRELVSMGYMTATQGSAVASGASKALDQALMRDSMKAYGKKVAQLYQDILQGIARVAGSPDVISVQGLDTYSVDNLEDLVATTTKLLAFSESIPKTAQKIWLSKLSGLLTGTVSPEDAQAIKDELDTLSLPTDSVGKTDSTQSTQTTL